LPGQISHAASYLQERTECGSGGNAAFCHDLTLPDFICLVDINRSVCVTWFQNTAFKCQDWETPSHGAVEDPEENPAAERLSTLLLGSAQSRMMQQRKPRLLARVLPEEHHQPQMGEARDCFQNGD